jgi:hypothetical protein
MSATVASILSQMSPVHIPISYSINIIHHHFLRVLVSTYPIIFSRVWVTEDWVRIGNPIYLPVTTRNCVKGTLTLSLYPTLCNSLQHALSLLSLLSLHQSSSNSFQRQAFRFVSVYELSPCLRQSKYRLHLRHFSLYAESPNATAV